MGRLTEIFFTAHPSCATQQKPRPSPPRKGRGFVYAHFRSLTRAKTHLRRTLSRTSLTPAQRPKTPLSGLQCESLRLLSKGSTRDRSCGVGHAASLPKRARSHGYHRLAHRRLLPPPPRLSLLMTSHEAMPIYFASFSLIVFWPHAERWISFASP